MKKKLISVILGAILILMILSSSAYLQDVSALERTTTAAVALADGTPYFLGEMNGELYYIFRSDLWKTDGTPAGTVLISMAASPLGPHLGPGPTPPIGSPKHYPKGNSVNGVFFYAADDGVHGQELWRSDGTSVGTFMVKDLTPGAASSTPEQFVAASNLIFFTINENCNPAQCELWRSDGSAAGTFLLTSVPASVSLSSFTSLNGLLFFNYGNDIWVSDGTVSGTSLLTAGAYSLAASGQKFYYVTTSDQYLWATNGSVGGAVSLTNYPVNFHTCFNGMCYFSRSTPSGGGEMWVTDGAPSGTIKLADMTTNGGHQIADGNGIVYFTNGSELWKTDGTPAGTLFIIGNLSGTQFTTAYGQLFFISSNQLWKSDGTAAGTAMVTGFGNSQTLSKIFVVNGKLLLKIVGPQCSGYLCSQDWQLYKSDGTQTGTLPVADFSQTVLNCPTPLCFALTFSPENSTVSDGKWFFEALDSVSHSPKLWMVTDVFFQDVPPDYWAFKWVEKLANSGITGGCGAGIYCPDATVTRAQMAIFLLKGMHDSSYSPPAVGASTGFSDVATDYWAAAWIKQLSAEGITGGCGSGNYCPDATVTRAQMAVFLLKGKHGSSYTPPNATGVFTDVPVGYWADKWIEQLAVEGITSGCGTGIYCPDADVTRAQMAVFLVKTFNLP